MDAFLREYLIIGLVGLLGVLLAGGALTVGRLVRPKTRAQSEQTTYESGAEPVEGGWDQSNIRYYLYALLFLIFDIEVAFIIPWAVQVEGLGGFGLVEMLIFVVILALGLAYAWRKKVFSWHS